MALLLALLVWLIMVAGVVYCWMGVQEMLPAISDAGTRIDSQLMLTLVVAGVAFVLAHAALGWFIFKYRESRSGTAVYIHGNHLVEVGGVVLTGIVFVGLAIMGQGVWASVHLSGGDRDPVRVEITAEQFLWNMRYPGPDGRFGKTLPEHYQTAGNTVGIVPGDAEGRDDIILQNNLIIPVDRPVELTLRSKDVLHSFFVPAVRLKQDAVPGLAIPLRFTVRTPGEYEIACAELCGLAHYRMRGFMKVLEPDAYEAWLAEQTPALGG